MTEYRKKQIVIIVSILIGFILIRTFWLWYFKINLLALELEEIKIQLAEIKALLQ